MPLQVRYLSTLALQREIVTLPVGMARFKRYLEVMLQRDVPSDEEPVTWPPTQAMTVDDMRVPLSLFNPMAKPHVAELLDHHLAHSHDDVAAGAAQDAASRIGDALDDTIELSCVVVDDLGGGWTHRGLTEARARFEQRGSSVARLSTVCLWSGDAPLDAAELRLEVAAEVYRTCHHLVFGAPRTLAAMLRQEGRALAFADDPRRDLEPDDLAYSREVIEALGDADAFPTCFAAMYGDDLAEAAGFHRLGLSAFAGFAVAKATTSALDPVDALRRRE